MYRGRGWDATAPTDDVNITKISRSGFFEAADSIAQACLSIQTIFINREMHQKLAKFIRMVYLEVNLTMGLPWIGLTRKKIAFPGVGCFLAFKISAKYSTSSSSVPKDSSSVSWSKSISRSEFNDCNDFDSLRIICAMKSAEITRAMDEHCLFLEYNRMIDILGGSI